MGLLCNVCEESYAKIDDFTCGLCKNSISIIIPKIILMLLRLGNLK
jgi:hypothetical protein